MEIESLFKKAVAETDSMILKPANETLLQLYSLYNQATKGDADISTQLNSYDNASRAKYDAWASLKGKSVKDAQQEYIMLVYKLKN